MAAEQENVSKLDGELRQALQLSEDKQREIDDLGASLDWPLPSTAGPLDHTRCSRIAAFQPIIWRALSDGSNSGPNKSNLLQGHNPLTNSFRPEAAMSTAAGSNMLTAHRTMQGHPEGRPVGARRQSCEAVAAAE